MVSSCCELVYYVSLSIVIDLNKATLSVIPCCKLHCSVGELRCACAVVVHVTMAISGLYMMVRKTETLKLGQSVCLRRAWSAGGLLNLRPLQGSVWVRAQPMRDDVTMQRRLSLDESIPKMIPALIVVTPERILRVLWNKLLWYQFDYDLVRWVLNKNGICCTWHYVKQCWLSSMTSYGATRPQLVKKYMLESTCTGPCQTTTAYTQERTHAHMTHIYIHYS